jgi:hypothetical protein
MAPVIPPLRMLAALAWIISVGISFKKYRTVIPSKKNTMGGHFLTVA